VDGLGWIEDPAAEIDSWSLMVVPIRAGGGTRVKVAEGLARSCPMVATRLGAFGYDLVPGEEILLSDNPDQFAQACLSILRNPEFGEALARRGLAKYESRWTWDAIAPRVEAAVDQALVGFEAPHPNFSTAESAPHRAEFQH
jgi:glycosyltransferase involved in cell wall biosynthesis